MSSVASPALCRTCGAPLPGGKWSDACPRCLVAAFSEEDRDDTTASVIPGYTILEEISRGGMGVVYRARQQQPNRVVALKMILPHLLHSPMIRARFQAEAESVAKLDHPNVLPIYEAGESRGVPYLTMKLVAGGSLSAQRAKFLGQARTCAELVAAAARGVQHAHERGILHRDLKPANLLLDAANAEASPIPMVSDFGLARILEAEPSGLTAPSAFLGTAGYLAPELVFGDSSAPTVQADIYSLGAILYELISGQLPFGAESGLEALRRADRESPPSLRALDPRISKDLDAICLTCLQREPALRYRSAGMLADDLDRFLEGSAVLARKDTFGYRAAKFARRNRAGLAVAAFILLILVGGIISTRREAQVALMEKARAEGRFNEVRKLANTVLFDYHDAIKSLPGSTKVRERLVKDALTYLDSLSAEAHGDIALQRELAAAYERVGDVRGGLRAASLGDTAGAADSYTKALRIREALRALQPGDAQARRDLANAQRELGTCLTATEPRTAVEHLNTARTLLLELTREQPTNEELLKDLTDTSSALGQALAKAGDLNGALEQYRAAATIPQRLVEKKPREPKYILLQVTAEQNLARALWEEQGDEAGAKAAVDKALELLQALIAEDPLNTTYQLGLAYFYSYGGSIRQENDPPAALDYFRRAAELREKLMKADPANSAAETGVADSYFGLARTLSHQDDLSQALYYYSKSAEHYEKQSAAGTNPNWTAALKAVTTGAGAAAMRARSGSTDLALRECSRLTAHLGEIPDDPTNIRNRLFRAEACEYLGYAYRDIAAASKASVSQSKQYAAVARDMFRQSVNIFDDARSRGGLDIQDTKEAKSVAEEMAKCDAALGK